MRPAEEIHLINAKRRVKRKQETTLLDIRSTGWEKVKGKWKSSEGWIPSDPLSVYKIDEWVKEITRIAPAWEDEEQDNSILSEQEVLDQQLSAVEGHKKVEILTTWKDKTAAIIEEPQEIEEMLIPIGIELEKKPWAESAKIICTLLAGVAVAAVLIYSNNVRRPEKQTVLTPQVGTDTEILGFSSPIKINGAGTIYLYNQDWETENPIGQEDIKQKLKPTALKLVSDYSNLQLENIALPKEERRKRIRQIDDDKIPMLVIVPEGKDLKENNTKIWLSKSQLILIERTINDKTTWSVAKIKNNEKLNTSILNR